MTMSWDTFRRSLLLGALYLAGTVIATLYLRTVANMTLFWPSAGLGLAMVLRYGLRQAWVAPAAVLVLHLVYDHVPASFIPWSMAANLVGLLAGGAYVLRERRHFTLRMRDGLLLLRGGIVLALTGAAVGVTGLLASGMSEAADAPRIFAQWALGDLLGVTVAGPLSMLLMGDPQQSRPGQGWHGGEGGSRERIVWGLLLVGSILTLVTMGARGNMYALALIAMPLALLMWAAVRYPAAITMMATVATTVVIAIVSGVGVWGFPRPPTREDALVLMLLLIVLSMIPTLLQSANYERRVAMRALHERATRDPLTGLLNRDTFEQRARGMLGFGNGPLSLLYMDLDHFKLSNDMGSSQAAGDEVLRQIGQLVRDVAGETGLAARTGGDEFALLLPLPETPAQASARRLLTDIEGLRVAWEGRIIIATGSIGLVATHAPSPGFDALFAQADAACSMAKKLGGNRLQTTTLHERLRSEADSMGSALLVREAIEHRRFHLYCQPIVDLQHSEAKHNHFEILLRWNDADGELRTPSALVAAAEYHRLGPRLDRHVIETVLRWMRAHPHVMMQGHCFSVNIGGASVVDEEFAEFLGSRLRRSGVAPDQLCLEITETNVVRDFSRAQQFIARMRAMGCRFALDDFGTGFCSFGYLRNLDVDYLKIDGSFVREMGRVPMADAVVRSIADIAHVLGRKTVAEHVEHSAQLVKLRALGVDYGQGYAFGDPMPIDAFFEAANNTSSINAAAVTGHPAPGP